MLSSVVLVLNNIDSEINLGTKRWRVRGTDLAARSAETSPVCLWLSGIRYSRPTNSRIVALNWS
jgi:hypothetical protein